MTVCTAARRAPATDTLPMADARSAASAGLEDVEASETVCGQSVRSWVCSATTLDHCWLAVPRLTARTQVDVSFHGVPYIVTVSTLAGGDTLCVEVEQKADASRWRGDFTARCACMHARMQWCCCRDEVQAHSMHTTCTRLRRH